MRKRERFRLLAWLAVGTTAAAMGTAMIFASAGGAAGAPEQEYTSHFETECILAPGVLNQKGVLKVSTKATGPEFATPGEEFTIKNATIAVVTPKEWGETLYNVGSRKAKGFVLSTDLDTTGAEPARRNIAKPAEFPAGLPFKTVVEPKEVEFTVPSEGRTFSLGAYHVTGRPGETVKFTLDTAAGYREISPGNYESTGEGIQSETTGVNEAGENVIGPIPVSCTAPAGVVEGEAPIVAPASTSSTSAETTSSETTSTATTSSTSSTQTSSTTTSTTSTASGTPPTVSAVEPSSGALGGNTPVRIVGTHLTKAEERCVSGMISPCRVSVHFGAREASIVAAAPTNLLVQSPAGEAAGAVDVTVTVAGLTSALTPADMFTYTRELEELEEKLVQGERTLP
jgi:hypothetical protein